MPKVFSTTVELRSKGPGRKGNPPIGKIISGPISNFPIDFFIGYKEISVYEIPWSEVPLYIKFLYYYKSFMIKKIINRQGAITKTRKINELPVSKEYTY